VREYLSSGIQKRLQRQASASITIREGKAGPGRLELLQQRKKVKVILRCDLDTLTRTFVPSLPDRAQAETGNWRLPAWTPTLKWMDIAWSGPAFRGNITSPNVTITMEGAFAADASVLQRLVYTYDSKDAEVKTRIELANMPVTWTDNNRWMNYQGLDVAKYIVRMESTDTDTGAGGKVERVKTWTGFRATSGSNLQVLL
jgi:hypothetical protein